MTTNTQRNARTTNTNALAPDAAIKALNSLMTHKADEPKLTARIVLYIYHDAEAFSSAWMTNTLKSEKRREQITAKLLTFDRDNFATYVANKARAEKEQEKKNLSDTRRLQLKYAIEDNRARINAGLVNFERCMKAALALRDKNPLKVELNKEGRIVTHSYMRDENGKYLDENGQVTANEKEAHVMHDAWSLSKLQAHSDEIAPPHKSGTRAEKKDKPATEQEAAAKTVNLSALTQARATLTAIKAGAIKEDDTVHTLVDTLLLDLLRFNFTHNGKVDSRAVAEWISKRDVKSMGNGKPSMPNVGNADKPVADKPAPKAANAK